MKLLSGKEVASQLSQALACRVLALTAAGIRPKLAIVRVGENPSDLAYERGAKKRAELVGVAVESVVLPEDASYGQVIAAIDRCNQDGGVHGVLLFRPLPAHLRAQEDEICSHLLPQKDVDGITNGSAAGVFLGKPLGFAPCTPTACMKILEHYGIDCAGKTAVVIGRSPVVGRPAAMMLLQKNATVTICHTKTKNMAAIARQADILIAAAGRAGVVDASFVRPGMIVVDVGVNWSEEKQAMVGDVAFDGVAPIVDAITPVPGGVGAVTSTVLMSHVVEAAEACKR